MKKLITITICAIILIYPSYKVFAVDISANAAVVMVADTAKLAYSHNPHIRLPMASTTKIMTAIIALESACSLELTVCIPKSACGIEGSSIYLYEGEEISFEQLLFGLLLESGNDAATAIALTVAESEDDFVDMMNAKAGEIGLENTHFCNPHGLSADGHYTSAYDLALLMRYCMQNEDFLRIIGTKSLSFESKSGTLRYFVNHNKLLNTYDGLIGGKTGYTKLSGRCLVTCAARDGVELICVTLGSSNDYEEHKALYESYFDEYTMQTVSDREEHFFPVSGGEKETVYAKERLSVSLPLANRDEKRYVTKVLELSPLLSAPVERGAILGKASYYYDGEYVCSVPIIAEESIGLKNNKGLLKKLIDFIRSIFS